LLTEGRKSDADAWNPLKEVEFEPSAQLTRYFDFDAYPAVSQLRITVQDVMRAAGATSDSSVYLPSMLVCGAFLARRSRGIANRQKSGRLRRYWGNIGSARCRTDRI